MRRECQSCGSRAAETPFPERGKLCCDCLAESLVAPRPEPRMLLTRASYRARLRSRQRLAQLDLVDLVVRAP